MPRRLDHFVICVHDLAQAATDWQRLGFALTPVGVHPFDTSNRLAMFENNFFELLAVTDRGARALIADMTATTSCDHAGADAVERAFRRAVICGTELRLVVTAEHVSRVLSLSGLDHLVPIYPSLEAATAASPSAEVPAGVAGPGLGGGRSWGESTVGYGR